MSDSHNREPFGILLRRHRLAIGLTQERLAERSGVAKRTIQDLERGVARPRRETVSRLVDALKLSPEARAGLEAVRRSRRPRVVQSTSQGPWAQPVETGARAQRHHGNLPVPRTRLIGREQELTTICQLLLRDDVGLVTLTGPPGTGKTRLGLQAAAEVRDHFPDGTHFVALAPIADPELVPATIAQALEIRDVGGRPVLDSLKDYVRPRRLLLLLDNFEQILSAAPVVSELLEASTGLKVLVTSRASLELRGEYERNVPPLALPDRQHPPPADTLSQVAAVALFVERAAAIKPNFAVIDDNASIVAEICHRLDGLPLALELAAARIKLLSPDAMLARLEHRLPLLTRGARDLPERQRTLRGAIDWSYELLSEAEQRLFRRLSVFVGGSTIEAIDAVCNRDGTLAVDILEDVASLVDKSLLRHIDGPDREPRFTMLETVREFAAERLSAIDEQDPVRRWHAEYYLAFAEQARAYLRGSGAASWLDRLDAEHDNLRVAIDWGEMQPDAALEGGNAVGNIPGIELATRIAKALAWFWMLRSQLCQGRERVHRLLARSRPGTPAHARALLVAGAMAGYLADAGEALRLSEASLTAWRALRDPHHVAVALARVGYAEGMKGRLDRARAALEESLAVSGDPRQVVDLENPIVLILAIATASAGDREGAKVLFEQSLALGRADGDIHTTLAALRRLGALARQRGEVEAAHRLIAESLGLARELGDYLCSGNALAELAYVAIDDGQAERAALLLAVLGRLHELTGMPFVSLSAGRSSSATARAILGDEAFDAACARGRRMTLEQAVAYALEEPAAT